MDIMKYRLWYLSENWGTNDFHMVVKRIKQFKRRRNGRIMLRNHNRVLSGEAFWINEHELCIGYQLGSDPSVFRPIFSHARQRLLEVVHLDIISPNAFWNNVKGRYFQCLALLKRIPLECIIHIVQFLYI